MCQLFNQINVKLFEDQFELIHYPKRITHKLLFYFIVHYKIKQTVPTAFD